MPSQWSESTTMNLGELETVAESMLQSAGMDDGEAHKMTDLASSLLGKGAVRVVPHKALPAKAQLATVNGRKMIFIQKGLTSSMSRWAVAHELAHWGLGIDSSHPHNEVICEALAARLIIPRRAYAAAANRHGHQYRRLAKSFVTTESCVALRHGEVSGRPLALISPALVRHRGDQREWPHEMVLRNLDLVRAKKLGFERIDLSDAARRFALLAA